MSKRAGHYEVGYSKPPKHTQWKKGQSGNPRGRPKGRKNLGTLLLSELNRKIPIREHGTMRLVTIGSAIMKQLVKKALEGENQAIKLLADLERTTAPETTGGLTFVIEG